MKILVACEFSGVIRDAFKDLGHDAISCDLLPTEKPGKHFQGDIFDFLEKEKGFDLMIAHPPCTYLALSGIHWNYRIPGRKEKTEEALEFVKKLMLADIPRIAIENPVSIIATRIKKPSQYIQPYQFGVPESKKTGLWLKNLPLLKPTNILKPIAFQKNGKSPRWNNQTPSGQNKIGPGVNRWKERSKTYKEIARAMAEQWGNPENTNPQINII